MKDPKTQLCTTITNKVKGMTIPNCVRKANVRLSTQAWLKVEKIKGFFLCMIFFSYFLIFFFFWYLLSSLCSFLLRMIPSTMRFAMMPNATSAK